MLARGLGFYFHHFGELKFDQFFGFLAAPVAFMTWLYCSATAILLGAVINSRLKPAKRPTLLAHWPHMGEFWRTRMPTARKTD